MGENYISIGALAVLAVIVWFMLSAILYAPFFKRFYDIVLSIFAIIFLSPIFLFLIVVGLVKWKGNPFFTQIRPGRKGKLFRLIKFKTMSDKKDERGQPLSDEKRLTAYGKKLRNTSLDELPELFNVLLGQMSLVGPRPLLVRDEVFMTKEVKKRHDVRGGITGLAQVRGRNAITWEEKFDFDLRYVKNITFFGDIKILLQTFYKVFKKEGVVRDGTVSDIDYGDWLLKKGLISENEYEKGQTKAKEKIKRARKTNGA